MDCEILEEKQVSLEHIAASILTTALDCGKFYLPLSLKKRLEPHCIDPEALFAFCLQNGLLEEDRGQYGIKYKIWETYRPAGIRFTPVNTLPKSSTDSYGTVGLINPQSGLVEYLPTQAAIRQIHFASQDVQTLPVNLLKKEVSFFYSLADTIEKYGPKKNNGNPREFNTFWCVTKTVGEVCEMIKSDKFSPETDGLRAIPRSSPENKRYKSMQFAFVCWSGTFSYKSDKRMIKHSGLVCVDVDYLNGDLDRVRRLVEDDPMTRISFVSPNADGLKVVYEVDTELHTQADWYALLSRRLTRICNLTDTVPDSSCSDKSRACFLPSDPNLFLRLI